VRFDCAGQFNEEIMRTVFESDDLDEIMEFVSAGYASSRVKVNAGKYAARISLQPFGPVRIDRVQFGFDFDYTTNPLGTVSVTSVESGTIPHHVTEGSDGGYGPGDVFLAAQPDRPYTGRLCDTRLTFTSLEPSLLSQVADTEPARYPAPVRLTGYRPVSAEAGRHLVHTITYVRDHILTSPAARDAPLIVATATRLLAATVLSTFPNSALLDPTIEDRHDANPQTLQRAIAFIDDHAQLDIGVADIAAAAHVTIRALQYAFRAHHGTTPTAYLRRVRLHHTHQELLAADPTTGTTVTEIAARWGFFHPGRFAQYYRASYGRSPYQTLLRHAS
jgi:AraC-like DNA-binding protein